MIITRLVGGLGNQMFQYAVGRALAHRLNVPFKLDKTPFDTYELHEYALGHFRIREQFATQDDLDRVDRFRGWKRRTCSAAVACLTLGAVRPIPYVTENGHNFDSGILDVTHNAYLVGYWQTQRYFTDIEQIIRNEFTPRATLDQLNQSCADTIGATANPVSLHVRRGDYVSDAETTAKHGLCLPDYYERCLQLLKQKVSDPHVFVFSDDIDWARQALPIDCPATYFGHNGPDRNYADLVLMSRCRHHIIANSTFSWWGAWLNGGRDKLVFAPDRFFDDPDRNDADLVPADWIKVRRDS